MEEQQLIIQWEIIMNLSLQTKTNDFKNHIMQLSIYIPLKSKCDSLVLIILKGGILKPSMGAKNFQSPDYMC